MTILDEPRLRELLADAVHGVDPSPGAERHVLAAARAAIAEDVAPRPVAAVRQHPLRTALATAAVVLVGTAVVLSLGVPGAHAPARPVTALGRSAPTNAGGTANWSATTYYGADGSVKSAGANQGTVYLGPMNGYGLPTTGAPLRNGSAFAGTQAAKVVAVGTVALRVPSARVQPAIATLSTMATHADGYVANSSVHAGTSGGTATATIVLRVPQPRYSGFVTAVERVGTVTSVATTSTDVTAQYVDYQARIAALEESRAQYLAILQKATTIGDILAVQAQVNTIESQIDQLKGERNVLVNEAAYGTLTVSLNAGLGAAVVHESGIRRSFHQSVGGFVAAFEALLRAAGPALFVLLCLAAVGLLARSLWRVSRRRLI